MKKPIFIVMRLSPGQIEFLEARTSEDAAKKVAALHIKTGDNGYIAINETYLVED